MVLALMYDPVMRVMISIYLHFNGFHNAVCGVRLDDRRDDRIKSEFSLHVHFVC